MNQRSFPTIAEWRRLVQAAMAFRKLAPWRWMSDGQLFAVQEPALGQIGYCCVLGALDQKLALAVYPGSEGFGSIVRLQHYNELNPDIDLFYGQRCLMASFEPRERLEKEDRAILAQLGLRFRGRDAWPLFRSHRPGYVSWFLDPAEANLLTVALEQGLLFCQRLQDDPWPLPLADSRCILTLVPEGDGTRFREDWTLPPVVKSSPSPLLPLDEVRLLRMRKGLKRNGGTLEFDWFYVPSAIREGERPYFPRAVAVVESISALALGVELITPSAGIAEMVAVLLHAMEQSGNLPSRLRVRRPELAGALEPLAGRLKLRLEVQQRMDASETFRDHLCEHFGQGQAIP